MADSSAASIDYAPYLVKSTRLSAAKRTLRRADVGKTNRKLFIAGSRLVPKRGASLALTAEQYELEKERLRGFTAAGIIEVHEHKGDGEYAAVDFDTEKASEPVALLEDEKVEGEVVDDELEAPEEAEDSAEEEVEDEEEDSDEEPEVESYTREQLEGMTKAQITELLSDAEREKLTGKEKKDELIDLMLV